MCQNLGWLLSFDCQFIKVSDTFIVTSYGRTLCTVYMIIDIDQLLFHIIVMLIALCRMGNSLEIGAAIKWQRKNKWIN